MAALRRDSLGVRQIDRAAHALLAEAIEGDLASIIEVGERLDGSMAPILGARRRSARPRHKKGPLDYPEGYPTGP